MVKVSEALFDRIRERVEQLIHKRMGDRTLSQDERAVLRDELRTLISGARSVSNKDLARIAAKVVQWKTQTQTHTHHSRNAPDRSNVSAVESLLPPVKSGTPSKQERSQVGRLAHADTPSIYSAVSSQVSVPQPPRRHPQPPRGATAGKSTWATGILQDVEKYHQEQAELQQVMKDSVSRHRADLERQVRERRQAEERVKEEDMRYLETQRSCNEEKDRAFLQQQEEKKRVWERAKAQRISDYHQRLGEKERRIKEEKQETLQVAQELNLIVESEKQKKQQRRLEKQQKVQELSSYLKEREKTHQEVSRRQREEERLEFLKNLDVLDQKEHERRRQHQLKKDAFARHQQAVDGMAPHLSKKGNQSWVDLGDTGAERREHERVKRLMLEETNAQARRRHEQATHTKAELDRQIQEKQQLTRQQRHNDDEVHDQLVRHLKMVEERERARRLEQKRQEQEHKRTLDLQVQHKRLEREALEIGV